MYEQTAQSLEAATERLRGNPHPGEFRKWRTARKSYPCSDSRSWAHPGTIESGARYLEIVILDARHGDLNTPTRYRLCEACGEGMK